MLKRLIQSSPEAVKSDIKIKIQGTYYKIEKELKVKNKAIYYLLGLYNENINDMMNTYIETRLPDQEQFLSEIFSYNEKNNLQLMKFENVSQQDSTNNYEIVPYQPKPQTDSVNYKEKA